MLAYFPYGTAARGSFAPMARTDTEQKAAPTSTCGQRNRGYRAASLTSGSPRMGKYTLCHSESSRPERFTASGRLCHT